MKKKEFHEEREMKRRKESFVKKEKSNEKKCRDLSSYYSPSNPHVYTYYPMRIDKEIVTIFTQNKSTS